MIHWIRRWWCSDRIRCTPGHFRLFQLEVGNRVLVRGRLWRVTAKNDHFSNSTVQVAFHLREVDELVACNATLQLNVNASGSGPPFVQWSGVDWVEELFEEDICILEQKG